MGLVRAVAVLVTVCGMMRVTAEAGVINITAGVLNTPNLGKVVATSTSTFRVDAASGTVTDTGSAIRIPSASVTTPQYIITCTGSGSPCSTSKLVTVTIQANTTSGPAFLAAPGGTVAVFNLGMDVTIPATATGSKPTPAYTITTTNN